MADSLTYQGLHLTTGLGQDTWFDVGKLQYRVADTQIGTIAVPTSTAYVFHKTDAGQRDVAWNHDDFTIPANLGIGSPTNSEVEVAYYYSNSDLDVQSSDDRATILSNASGFLDSTDILAEPVSCARYRYLIFDLSSDPGDSDVVLHEYGAIQSVRSPQRVALDLQLSVTTGLDGERHTPKRVEVARGSTPTFRVHYRTGIPANSPAFDLTGATIQFSLARTTREAQADGFPLVGPLSVGVDSATGGEASITLGTTVSETDLEPRDYVAEFLLKKGGLRYRHFVLVRVTDAVTLAAT